MEEPLSLPRKEGLILMFANAYLPLYGLMALSRLSRRAFNEMPDNVYDSVEIPVRVWYP
jgi:hypothetical protein